MYSARPARTKPASHSSHRLRGPGNHIDQNRHNPINQGEAVINLWVAL